MKNHKIGVGASKFVNTNQPRVVVVEQALILLFSCTIREYINHYYPTLNVKVSLDGLHISNIVNSCQLELLQSIVIPNAFAFTLTSGQRKEALFSYIGPQSRKLNAWRSVSAAVKLLQEEFSTEWNSKIFIGSTNEEVMNALLLDAEELLSN